MDWAHFRGGMRRRRTRLMLEIRLVSTDCAERPTMMPETPPTVRSGWMLTPTTCIAMRAPAATTIQLASPLKGSTTRSMVAAAADWARSLEEFPSACAAPSAHPSPIHTYTPNASRAVSRSIRNNLHLLESSGPSATLHYTVAYSDAAVPAVSKCNIFARRTRKLGSVKS